MNPLEREITRYYRSPVKSRMDSFRYVAATGSRIERIGSASSSYLWRSADRGGVNTVTCAALDVRARRGEEEDRNVRDVTKMWLYLPGSMAPNRRRLHHPRRWKEMETER